MNRLRVDLRHPSTPRVSTYCVKIHRADTLRVNTPCVTNHRAHKAHLVKKSVITEFPEDLSLNIFCQLIFMLLFSIKLARTYLL